MAEEIFHGSAVDQAVETERQTNGNGGEHPDRDKEAHEAPVELVKVVDGQTGKDGAGNGNAKDKSVQRIQHIRAK